MTDYTSDAVDAGIMPDYSRAGVLLSRTAVFTTTADLLSRETIKMVPIPKGAQIINIMVENNSLCQWCGLASLQVGDGNDTDRFFKDVFTGGAAGGAQVNRNDFFSANTLQRDPLASHVYTYTADDTIDLFLGGTENNTGLTGTTIAMTVVYKMEGEIGDEDF